MIQQVQELKSQALRELGAIAGPEDLERWRISYLGRKGSLTQILRGLGSLPQEERRQAGSSANDAKRELESALAQKGDGRSRY